MHKLIKYKNILVSLCFIFFGIKAGYTQIFVGGLSCVPLNVEYSFYLQGNYTWGDNVAWYITGGVSSNGNTYESGTNLTTLRIKFTQAYGTITIYTCCDYATLNVSAVNALQGGSITAGGTQTISYNSIPSGINASLPSGGYCTPSYNYQWEKSTDNVNWTSISGKTGQNVTFSSPPDNLTQTTYIRRKVSESYSSSVAYSNTATVNVNQPLNPHVVGPATQNIFSGDNTTTIGGGPAYNGDCGGSYSYQWQSSTNGTTFNDISSANSLTYSPGFITQTTYYRRKVTCGFEIAYTASVVVNVYSHFTIGSISTSVSTVLTGTSPGQISGTSATPGMCGNVSYQWQQGDVNGNWSDISGATGQNYTPGNLTSHTYFKRRVTCGSESGYSNSVYITVYDPLTAGVLSGGNSPIYSDQSPGVLSLGMPSGGNCSGTYTYEWYQSTDGVNFSIINGLNGLMYGPGVLQPATYYYYVKIICGSTIQQSNTRTITVYPALIPGSITTNWFSIPYNTVPATINATAASGGNCGGSYNYKWQFSTDNSTWQYTAITGQNLVFPGQVTQGYYYRREVECNGIKKYTNSIGIVVVPEAGSISCSQSITPGGTVSTFSISNSGGGAPGITASYQWQSSTDEITWGNISGATATTYTPSPSPSVTTYYRARVTFGTVNMFANTVRVKVKTIVATNIPNSSTANSTQTTIAMPSYPGGTDANNQNYVRTRTITNPVITALSTANALTNTYDVMQVTEYLDGLGRPTQSVAQKATPAGADMISTSWYDSYGRIAQKYLPYTDGATTGGFRTDATTQQTTFYNTYFNNTENFYYSNAIYENSPLNKVLKETAPGKSWTGSDKGVRVLQRSNRVEEDVKIWTVSFSIGSVPSTSSVYPKGELIVTEITDEMENKTIEYKDKEGKIIMKKVLNADVYCEAYTGWICTYYIYDKLGQLRWVLQPKAVEWLLANSWNLGSNATIQDQLCFRYEYDDKKRMIIKKIPGSGEVSMVYDNRDRLVMTQDENLRIQGTPQWVVTVYDNVNPNRPIKTGLLNNSNTRAYHEGQAAVTTTGTNYPSTASGFDLMTETYYDDYTYSGAKTYDATLNSNLSAGANPFPETVTQSNLTKTMLTGTKTKVLGTSTYLISTTFYDSKSRVIETKSDNVSGGEDIIVTQYDFAGRVLSTYMRHQKPTSTTINVLTKMNYGQGGRLLSIIKSVNGASDKMIVQNSYDELGLLKKKELGKKPDNSFVETQDNAYNIRGWLGSINKDFATNSGTNANNRLFGMMLSYDFGFAQNQLNGNIGGARWRSRGDGEQRAYGFDYDNLNRLLKADFTQNSSGWNVSAGIDFSVSNLSYDVNGNIISQNQKGWKITGSTFIDRMAYNYKNLGYSNQLLNVIDTDNDPATKLGDFRTSTLHPNSGAKINTTTDYVYDANGNMVKDYNKDFVTYNDNNGIQYNYLNLPSIITMKASASVNKGTITYTYDATGTKLKKVTIEQGAAVTYNGTNYTGITITTTTTYIGAIVYESKSYSNSTLNTGLGYADQLQFVAHEEGRMRLRTSDNSFQFDYFLKDHLGNVRMVVTDEVKTDIYPAATMEDATYNGGTAISVEDDYYSVDNTKIVASPSGVTYQNNNGNPPYNTVNLYSNTGATSAKMYKLNATTNTTSNKIGLGIVLKVMAGDVISIYGNLIIKDHQVTIIPIQPITWQ